MILRTGGDISFVKESGGEIIKASDVSSLRNIQTLDGPKGDSRQQNFVISLHEKSRLFNLESFKSGTPLKNQKNL